MACNHKPGASVRRLHTHHFESLGFSDPVPGLVLWIGERCGRNSTNRRALGRLGCEPLYWSDPGTEAPGLVYFPWAWARVRAFLSIGLAGAARTGPSLNTPHLWSGPRGEGLGRPSGDAKSRRLFPQGPEHPRGQGGQR